MGKASRHKEIVSPVALAQYRVPILFVVRSFKGLPRGVGLVAMREITLCVTLIAYTDAGHGFVGFDFMTALPDGRGAMVRGDGRILMILQTRSNSGDLLHDAGTALLSAVSAKQNGDKDFVDSDACGPFEQSQDILDPDSFGEMVLEENFTF